MENRVSSRVQQVTGRVVGSTGDDSTPPPEDRPWFVRELRRKSRLRPPDMEDRASGLSGLAGCGSHGSRSLGSPSLFGLRAHWLAGNRPGHPPELHCLAGFQFWPPELRYLGQRVTASLPSSSLLCLVFLSLWFSPSLLISLSLPVGISLSFSLSLPQPLAHSLFLPLLVSTCSGSIGKKEKERKNNEEGRRKKTKKEREKNKIIKE
jgi:hypothetical protein